MGRFLVSFLTRLVILLAVILPTLRAQAGGLFLLDRGSKAMSMGGAWVAGADDPGALWYNPAGLARSKDQLIADFTWTFLMADFTRQYEDGSFAPKVSPNVVNLPIPTLAVSHRFGLEHFTFGAGIFAPNTMLLNWPRSVPGPNDTRDPGPTRYSLLSLQGSILANVVVGLAWHPHKRFSIGADAQFAIGRFKASNALSASDGVVCTFPEQPDCDVYTDIDVLPAWGITGVFGMTVMPVDWLTIGASAMLPYTLGGPAKLDLTKPTNEVFADAYFEGDEADFKMNFPLIVRGGIEFKLLPYLKIELAGVWERWSTQKNISVDPTEEIWLRNIVGISDYQIDKLLIPRSMRDAWSARYGLEFAVPDGFVPNFMTKLKLILRSGLAYEKSAFADSTTTPMTLDSDKWVLTGGSSIKIHKKVRMEGTIGYAFMRDMNVRNSEILQPTSIRPQPTTRTALGNGNYNMDALYIGGSLVVKLD
jgi:long-chain fatty acid transport protein